MQRDAWYSSMRNAEALASPAAVGRYAAERALSRLKSRKIATTECPVLFESPLAAGLLGGFVQAISGGALYRKSTFLLDSLGTQVFPKHIDISEDPFLMGGKGSAPFDDEGVRVSARKVVDAGRVEGYFLGSYSARKLGMKTTGNAGGSHNLVLTSRQTKGSDDLDAMLQKLGTGLFVIELMGQGVNYVTGDYSRGAAGFWALAGRQTNSAAKVAARMRTSVSCCWVDPTRMNVPVSSTRNSLTCRSSGISVISSRNRVPPSASSHKPARSRSAPVNAPRTCPKSSESINSDGIAPQLTATNAPEARLLR